MYTTRTTLLEKIAAGDEIGWHDFFHTYQGLIRAVALQSGVPAADCDDIVQQTMLGVFHNGAFAYRRELHGKFRTWLGGVIRHKIGDYFRREQHSGSQAAEISETGQSDGFETKFTEEYRRHLLEIALAELRGTVAPEIFETFTLCRQGRSDREVAALLDLKANTVTVRKRRCVEILNEVIRKLDAADPELKLPPL